MQTIDWKAKSIHQTRKSKELKKRIKELTNSRDEWKRKSIQHRERADKLVSDLKNQRQIEGNPAREFSKKSQLFIASHSVRYHVSPSG